MAPQARAAILLREVLDTEYDELANLLSKNMATCRRMVHWPTVQLRNKPPPPRDYTLHWLRGYAGTHYDSHMIPPATNRRSAGLATACRSPA